MFTSYRQEKLKFKKKKKLKYRNANVKFPKNLA